MTDKDVDITTSLLKQLEPGFLPYDIFIEFARLAVLSIVEVVPFRYSNGAVEVLLLKRRKDDAIWPNKLHNPGTVVRPTDASLTEEAFSRIVNDELNGTKISEPQFVKNLFRTTIRGKENVQLFWVEVLDAPKEGSFYSVDNLPDNLIAAQAELILTAAQYFRRKTS
ncbi:MAG TPA: hypothetical protein VMR95_03990 [Candidatus Binatia bacterium]|nr:hypothetical protein [Candidatus Binatia bacterium]